MLTSSTAAAWHPSRMTVQQNVPEMHSVKVPAAAAVHNRQQTGPSGSCAAEPIEAIRHCTSHAGMWDIAGAPDEAPGSRCLQGLGTQLSFDNLCTATPTCAMWERGEKGSSLCCSLREGAFAARTHNSLSTEAVSLPNATPGCKPCIHSWGIGHTSIPARPNCAYRHALYTEATVHTVLELRPMASAFQAL